MEKLMIIWGQLGDWFDANFDKPMFQMASGFVLGAVVVGLIWALCALYRTNMVIKVLAEQTKSVWSESWNETVNEAIREAEKTDDGQA